MVGITLWDDTTQPNVPADCSSHFDSIPQAVPYINGWSKVGLDSLGIVAWRDGGLVLQNTIGRPQFPNITNFALFNLDPADDVSSMAHDNFSCAHYQTLQYTPWHNYDENIGSNGVGYAVNRMTNDGRFGTAGQQIISVGPGDAMILAQGLDGPLGIDVYPPFVPTTSGVGVFFKIESPLNVLITASDGRRIGADLITGAPINDFGTAGYDSQTSEPRIYGLRDPSAGNFTIRTKGTGSGPYTITTYGANLATDVITQAPFAGNTVLGAPADHRFALDAAGVVTPLPPTCSNGLDDDGDGRTDYQVATSLRDFGCTGATDPSESGAALCDDGIDNDGDGGIDYRIPSSLGDIGCSSHRSPVEAPQCQDGINNDLATGIDFDGGASANGGTPLDVPDPQCTAPTLGTEAPAVGGCGFGPELAFALPLLAAARRRRRSLSG